MNNLTAKTLSRAYFAFTALFGFYLMSHGHISHGAGFAGGVMLALAFLQALIVNGSQAVSRVVNIKYSSFTALAAASLLVILAVLGFFYGNGFLADVFGAGEPFELFSGGIIAVFNILLCLGTAGCLIFIFLSFFGSDRKR